MLGKVEWGPEIQVDGSKPDWLPHKSHVWVHWASDDAWSALVGWDWRAEDFDIEDWQGIDMIRLVWDHPYYNKQGPAQ